MPIRTGDLAPDFQLKDEIGKVRALAEFGGKLEATKIHKIINDPFKPYIFLVVSDPVVLLFSREK